MGLFLAILGGAVQAGMVVMVECGRGEVQPEIDTSTSQLTCLTRGWGEEDSIRLEKPGAFCLEGSMSAGVESSYCDECRD